MVWLIIVVWLFKGLFGSNRWWVILWLVFGRFGLLVFDMIDVKDLMCWGWCVDKSWLIILFMDILIMWVWWIVNWFNKVLVLVVMFVRVYGESDFKLINCLIIWVIGWGVCLLWNLWLRLILWLLKWMMW